jgi:hypothetical protein
LNKTKTFGIVEPFHGAFFTLRHNQPQITLYRMAVVLPSNLGAYG